MTLYSLIKTIKGLARIQPNISFVHSGDVYELNKRADIDYPAFIISQNTHRNDMVNDEEIYGFTLFAIDRLTSDSDNRLDIQSWANELLKGIIEQIEELGLGEIYGDYTIQPFTEKFESLCAGCYARIQVRIDNIDCDGDLWLMKLLEKIKNVIKFKDIEELEGVDPDTLLWYVGDKPIHIIDESIEYFNIEALEDGTIEMQHFGTNADTTTPVFEYSTDNVVWNTWDYSPINIRQGKKVYFRGVNTKISSSTSNYSTFNPTCTFNANGNIMSLLYGDDFKGQVSLSGRNYCFYKLFSNSKIVKAPELPATTLAKHCYSGMFYNCTSLTTAPELPATTLAHDCYVDMFNGCTSLTTAPELPATTLPSSCYFGMFYGCTSLTIAHKLPATTLADFCYVDMFRGCTSLTTAPELPATTLAKHCYSDMFYNCTSLTTAPELPATTLANFCYSGMFYNCTSLTTAPELPATTLADDCYRYMFNGCTSLTTAPELPATTLANSCYSYMFYGCTSLTTAPELPATTLENYCYDCMFSNCTLLTTAPELPATTLADGCYDCMFSNCTSLTTAPELPATTLADGCYNCMFTDCTSLTTAPELPATTLADGCYRYMFYGCTNLNSVKCNARYTNTGSLITSSIGSGWLGNVAPTGTFYKNPDWAGPTTRSTDTIPTVWTILNW